MTKIMLVEDDNNLREIYQARLLAEGYEIISARDGEEALALAVKEKPDLIIADIMMPKISGFDMLDILRTTPETKNSKVIMMTALSQAEDKERANKLGADRYLVKSQVTLEDVAKVARDVLEGKTEDSKPEASAAPASISPQPAASPEPTKSDTTLTPTTTVSQNMLAKDAASVGQAAATEEAEMKEKIEAFIKSGPTGTPAAQPAKTSTAIPITTPEDAPAAASAVEGTHKKVIKPLSDAESLLKKPDINALLAEEEKKEKMADAVPPSFDRPPGGPITPNPDLSNPQNKDNPDPNNTAL